MDKNQGYTILRAVMLENGRGFALGEHPTAPSPYVTWACYDDETGQRQYEWGHYGSDFAATEQDFTNRLVEYQRIYKVSVVQVEAPGLYKYYSTQRPVDIGTFPKPPHNAPDEIVNYDQRIPVEGGAFLAWGHLTYTKPLTDKQVADYELRPAFNVHELRRKRGGAPSHDCRADEGCPAAGPGAAGAGGPQEGYPGPGRALGGGEMPKYYPINEEAARRANDLNSFNTYKPGAATASYQRQVDAAYQLAEEQKQKVDPMYHDKIDYLVDLYARKLAENLNQSNAIDVRVPSILISGGGNFPVRIKEKQNAARDKNMGEYQHIQGLLDKIRATGTAGISSDDKLAVEKLEAKLEGLKTDQEHMKAVNAYYRKHKTLDGCPGLTPDMAKELRASMGRDWWKDPVPYPSFHLTNNNANIRRVQQRIDDLKNRGEFVGWTFPGGEAKINEAENRLQLFFEEKPTEDQRRELKSNGFKWAPSQGAWQRQLNRNAIFAAGRMDFLKTEDGQSPIRLQPFARQDKGEIAR